MSDQQFNVGNFVRVKQSGVVGQVVGHQGWPHVRLIDGNWMGFLPKELEPWTPRFGERVRHGPSGERGTVLSIYPAIDCLSPYYFKVKYDETGICSTYFGHLEPVLAEPVLAEPVNPDKPAPTSPVALLPAGWVRDGDGVLAGPDGYKIEESVAFLVSRNQKTNARYMLSRNGPAVPRPCYFPTEEAALGRWAELRRDSTAAPKFVRVPAIGQRVEYQTGKCSGQVIQHYQYYFLGSNELSYCVLVKFDDGNQLGAHHSQLKAIGPDPKFVEIAIREA